MSKRSDVVVDGIRLSILSEGQGTQGLFLLHGIGFGADSFLRNMQPPAAPHGMQPPHANAEVATSSISVEVPVPRAEGLYFFWWC